MKTVLVAIDAKYIHTNLAVRSIACYLEREGLPRPVLAEFTINQSLREILEALYLLNADYYLFSCYIWNIRMVEELLPQLKALRPNSRLFLGGSEASYRAEELLAAHSGLDGILLGEGEITALELLHSLEAELPLEACQGLCLSSGFTAPRPPLSMDELPFPYPDGIPEGRILYYESMRGCPFSCSYCLSSVEAGVRLRALPLVMDDLRRLLVLRPPQVKFVDRTFNCNKVHTMAIWRFLAAEDNGVTNFHFELAAELLDSEMLDFLSTLRPGLFQFEIGVQSANPSTLHAISRPWKVDRLEKTVAKLRAPDNIHLHLDLIAGLPEEDFASFRDSFNRVYAMRPHQLQLGFLKVLPGSKMAADAAELDILHEELSPYEVLRTPWLSFGELTELRGIAHMVELYHNSGRFSLMMARLIREFPTPFDCYQALWQLWRRAAETGPLSKLGQYELPGKIWTEQGEVVPDDVAWLSRCDIALHEKPKVYPSWAQLPQTPEHTARIRAFYRQEDVLDWLPGHTERDPIRLSRLTHLEIFPFHPLTGEDGETAILFDYSGRDFSGHARTVCLPSGIC
ncbi:MAG: DUF4080 domain-containing protein [Oscillospiraceae bacterium]